MIWAWGIVWNGYFGDWKMINARKIEKYAKKCYIFQFILRTLGIFRQLWGIWISNLHFWNATGVYLICVRVPKMKYWALGSIFSHLVALLTFCTISEPYTLDITCDLYIGERCVTPLFHVISAWGIIWNGYFGNWKMINARKIEKNAKKWYIFQFLLGTLGIFRNHEGYEFQIYIFGMLQVSTWHV